MKWLAPGFILALLAFGVIVAWDTPPLSVLPMLGFFGGAILWTRIGYLVIAVLGLRPNPGQLPKDPVAEEKAARRVVLGMASGWLLIFGLALLSLLHHGKTGFALLFAGILVVPVLNVTHFFVAVRRHQQRTATSTPHD